MTLRLIDLFQTRLYNVLMLNEKLKTQIEKIHLGVARSNEYPLITINLEQVTPNLDHYYEVNFQISIYAKDKNHKLLLELAQQIIELLKPQKINSEQLVVTGLMLNNLCFTQAKDLVINRLVMQYKSSIHKELR